MNPLAPLSLPYAAALALKNHAYTHNWLPQQRLRQPVISIGNLSVGGAGKTPFVIALAQLLVQRGLHPDVLSRGYGRTSPHPVERVDPSGNAARFGDEPLLIARATSLPVYVGASRYHAGLLAERQSPLSETIHLLDDSFQHRALVRSIDIVVIHPADAAGLLLPAGRLREPLRALARADFLVLRDHDTTSEPALQSAGIRKPIWRVRRTLIVPPLTGRAFAFCGIAHPNEFFHSLRAHAINLTGTRVYRDHHRFSPADIQSITAEARGCDAILTTEKDLVRLSPNDKAQLTDAASFISVPLRAELLGAGQCLDALLCLLHARHGQSAMRK